MKLAKENNTLTITLAEESTIIDVEAHTDLVRAIPDNINTILLKIDALKELDTAYLQCIYSLVKEAQERSITIQTLGKSKVFDHVCRLYGVMRIENSESQERDTAQNKAVQNRKTNKAKNKRAKA